MKLKINDNYEKDETLTTNFEPSNDPNVTNKAYLGEKLSQIEKRTSSIEKDYNDFGLRSDRNIEEV